MNRADLTAHIANSASLPKGTADKALDAVFDAISAALGRGEEIAIKGFGSFTVAERPARQGRNPKTGEPIPIPANKAPKFKPAKPLKDAVKG